MRREGGSSCNDSGVDLSVLREGQGQANECKVNGPKPRFQPSLSSTKGLLAAGRRARADQ